MSVQTTGGQVLGKCTLKFWTAALLFVLLVGIWFLPPVRSRLYDNLAWVELTHFVFDDANPDNGTLYYLRPRTSTGSDTTRMATGRLLYAFLTTPLSERESDFLASDTVVSHAFHWERILAVGEWLYSRARYQESMRIFAGVANYPSGLRYSWRTDADLAIGRICQLDRFSQLELAVGREIAATCATYWAAVNNNLIVNADFDSGHLRPWFQRHQRGIQYTVERIPAEEAGENAFAAIIRSSGTGVYGGIYQNLALPPGSRVRFTARLRVEAESGAVNISPLYIRGESNANDYWRRSLPALTESTDWIELENVYRIPADHQGLTAFYPVFFTGTGKIWLDDIRVEMLENDE